MEVPVSGTINEYQSRPYLIALPGNDYAVTGVDHWLYDATVELKLGRTKITKPANTVTDPELPLNYYQWGNTGITK